MSRLFISHSSRNDAQALALQEWPLGAGWGKDDIYLDISPDGSMAAGQRWVWAERFIDLTLSKQMLGYAKVVGYCLKPQIRNEYGLAADPSCWCQEKNYPSMSVWEDDYLTRNPELNKSEADGNWPRVFQNLILLRMRGMMD